MASCEHSQHSHIAHTHVAALIIFHKRTGSIFREDFAERGSGQALIACTKHCKFHSTSIYTSASISISISTSTLHTSGNTYLQLVYTKCQAPSIWTAMRFEGVHLEGNSLQIHLHPAVVWLSLLHMTYRLVSVPDGAKVNLCPFTDLAWFLVQTWIKCREHEWRQCLLHITKLCM